MIPIKRMIFYYLAFVEYMAGLDNTIYLEETLQKPTVLEN